MKRYPLAPMDRMYQGLSLFLGSLPFLFVSLTLMVPGPHKLMFGACAVFLFLIYAWIWFYWRPDSFRLETTALVLEFPRRQMAIDLSQVQGVQLYESYADFTAEWGFGIRIGAGGLFGAFGWLKTPKGTLQMYISRSSDLVVVELADRKPLLITPEQAQEFVKALKPI